VSLSNRQKLILKSIIEDFIQNAEPVSSKALVERWAMDYSSATIRNEMAALDALGFLEQPHTSAGRIPSSTGYRFYVNELMNSHDITPEEVALINQVLSLKIKELDGTIIEACKMLAKITNYPIYAATLHKGGMSVRKFDLMYIDKNMFAVIAVISTNNVKNKFFKTHFEINPHELIAVTNVLNSYFTNINISDITEELVNEAEELLYSSKRILTLVLNFMMEIEEENSQGHVRLMGVNNILRHPEFQDTEKAQKLLDFLSETREIARLPIPDSNDSIKIFIGDDDAQSPLHDASLVVASYNIGEDMTGLIGVVGPKRMEYAKLASRLRYFSTILSSMLQDRPFTNLP